MGNVTERYTVLNIELHFCRHSFDFISLNDLHSLNKEEGKYEDLY